MSDDAARSLRVRGEPNQEFLKKAKTKYKSYNESARTEFQRLLAAHNKQPLLANKDPVQHATFYHLNELRMQGDIR